ncbi:MAG: hypothetical protein ACI9VL_000186, partial [Colwellia sp.]
QSIMGRVGKFLVKMLYSNNLIMVINNGN